MSVSANQQRTPGVLNRVRALLHTPEPPGLGAEVRSHVQSADQLNQACGDLTREAGCSERQAALLLAAVLLWHDHLEAAHRIVQSIEDADASLLHAIMHRREPDYTNSKYWLHRVGDHPAYVPLAAAAKEFLEQQGEGELAERLLPGDRWDPFAFVDECQRLYGLSPDDQRYRLARELQRLEFEAILSELCRKPG